MLFPLLGRSFILSSTPHPLCLFISYTFPQSSRGNWVEEATLEESQFLLLVCWQPLLFIPG